MAEDLSKMKAQKTSKADSLNKLAKSVGSALSDGSKPKKSSSSSKSSSNNNTSKKTNSTSKSNSQKKTATTSQTNSDGQPVKRGRGRPRKYPLPEEQNKSIAEKVIETAVSSTTKKTAKKVDKAVKKSFKKQGLSLILFFAFLFVGICGGFVISRYVVFNVLYSNDTYEMVAYTQGDKTSYDVYIKQEVESSEEFTYTKYTELGVKCIAFGKDYSKDYTVQYFYRNDLSNDEVPVDKVDITKEGIYYAVYSVKPTKYKSVKLIRNIIVLRGENDE